MELSPLDYNPPPPDPVPLDSMDMSLLEDLGDIPRFPGWYVLVVRDPSSLSQDTVKMVQSVPLCVRNAQVKSKGPCPLSRSVPVRLFRVVLSATVNCLSDGRELTVSAGRLAKSPCPLSQFAHIRQSPV